MAQRQCQAVLNKLSIILFKVGYKRIENLQFVRLTDKIAKGGFGTIYVAEVLDDMITTEKITIKRYIGKPKEGSTDLPNVYSGNFHYGILERISMYCKIACVY